MPSRARPAAARDSVLSVNARSLSEWRGPGLQSVAQPSDTVSQADPIVGRQQKGLRIPLQERPGRDAVGRGGMLLEHGMSVDPGEAERIDPCAARVSGIAVNPRPRRGQEFQAAPRRAPGPGDPHCLSAAGGDGAAPGPS